jgi:hypothetical protein
MSEGPYGTPPSDTPPPEPPPAEPPAEPSAWESPPAEPPAAEAPAGESQAPGGYFPPPSGAPAAPAPRKRSGALVAIIAVVVIVIVAVLGYGIGGYAYAGGKLNSAQDAYNSVVDHQNSLNDTIKSLDTQLTSTDFSTATTSEIQQSKSKVTDMVTKSQSAQPQISSDDAALAKAEDSLNENSWLTLLRKPDIDKADTRIEHLRKALAVAKTLTADYVQVGTFENALLDVIVDLDDLTAKAQATDLNGATAADEKLKTDVDKAISLDKAPGMPTEMDTLLQDLKALANDFGTLLAAAKAGDSAGANAAEKSLEADAGKLQTVDYKKIGDDINSFYNPLIDQYNSEVDKANST